MSVIFLYSDNESKMPLINLVVQVGLLTNTPFILTWSTL